VKSGMMRLKKYSNVHTSFELADIMDYVATANYSLIHAIVQDNYQYKSDCYTLIKQEHIYAGFYKDLQDDMEEEKKLKVKNINYSSDLLEKDKERTFEMIDEIEEGARKLKVFFIKRLAI
jgi:hypothetical protein